MNKVRVWTTVVGLVGIAALTTSYFLRSGHDEIAVNDADLTITTVTDPRQITLPLDAYKQSTEDWRAFQNAVNLNGVACMKQLGFDWKVPDRHPPANEEPTNARRYGLVDLQHAQRYGYQRDPAELQYVATMKEQGRENSDAATRAWLGTPDSSGNATGCYAKSAAALGGLAPRDLERFVESLYAESGAQSENHPRVVAALNAWRSCMRQQGYSVDTPFTMADGKNWPGPEPTAEEIAVATADARCHQSTNLAGIWLAVETAYQKRIIEKNETKLAEMRQWLDTSSREAARILTGTH